MSQSIPISSIVSVTPGVLTAGGAAGGLTGLLLTDSTRVPIGTVQSFTSATAVAAYFGSSSTEADLATNYFLANDNSLAKPSTLLMAQYNESDVAGYMRGGSLASVSLDTLKTYSGTLTVSVDGTAKTSSTINLAAATSFSNAATIILAGFTAPGFTVTYDSVSAAFVFTSSTTGAASSMTTATGTLSTNLKLTAATGAVTSAGADAATPADAMDSIVGVTQAWSGFSTTFEPADDDKVLFAAWSNGQGNKYLYAMWDTSAAPATSSDTTSAGYQIQQADYSGVAPIWGPGSANVAAFNLGVMAALDFQQPNGRTNFAFRTQSGLSPDVTDSTIATNLQANGYNYYGSYANASSDWNFYYDGSVTGPFLWEDTYVNQIWLNAGLQTSLANLLINAGSVPYNNDGRTMIEAACQDVINTALSFGAIRAGVALSATQAAQVNQAAGKVISTTLEQRGWYLSVGVADAATRTARQSPPCTFYYVDGQSVQAIDLASIEIQ